MPAIGGSSTSARQANGLLWADVRDYGAKADNGLTDNSVPFQAAIDAVIAKRAGNNDAKCTVFIPSSPSVYGLSKPVFVDRDNIEIVGESRGAIVQTYANNSAFIFGIRRVENAWVNGSVVPLTIDSSYHPDLFGKLDSSAVNTAGRLWGIRTNNNSYAQFHAGPICSGPRSLANGTPFDYWSETTKLTLEFCIEAPDGQLLPTNAPVMGMGSASSPSPFYLGTWDEPNKFLFLFRTNEESADYSIPRRWFAFRTGAVSAPYRIAIQVDLVNAVCTAFVNGTQVALFSTGNLDSSGRVPFLPSSKLKFAPNEYAPFLIGADGIRGPKGPTTTGIDMRLYGMRISNTIRYQNNGVGQPQKRVDSPSTAINDAYSYFGQDANTVCFLEGTDNPATAGRLVTVRNGEQASVGGHSGGLFIHIANEGNVKGNAIRNISLHGQGSCGQGVCVGSVLDFTVDNVESINFYNGIGSFSLFANYFVDVRDSTIGGVDSCYFGCFQLANIRNIKIHDNNRVALRFLGGAANMENIFVAAPGANPECAFKAHAAEYGGNFTLRSMQVDFEGYVYSNAVIYCEAHGMTPSTSMVLSDIFVGTVGSTASIIKLKDTAPLGGVFHRCYLSVDNLQAYTTDYLAAVDVEGPLWHGEVRGVALGGPQFLQRKKFGDASNIVVRDSKFIGVPRSYLWCKGAHILEVRCPADGQYVEWRCVTTGTYGTSTPPVWVGLNPLFTTTSSLAAYVQNHGYITASLT